MYKVGIVVLNYNGSYDTLECLKSLSCVKCNTEVIVVDNMSKDSEFNTLKKGIGPNVHLIRLEKNLGYAGGNNVGIKKAIELNCDYFCILNNDTIIEKDFLSECIKELQADYRIAFIGPTIVDYSTNKVQSAGAMVSTFSGRNKLLGVNQRSEMLKDKTRCDYVGGACIICSRKIINEIGLIPECYFLFYEETEWCIRAKRAGYDNVCLRTVSIKHKGSVSINKTYGLNNYLLARNRMVFIKRNIIFKKMSWFVYIWLRLECFLKAIKWRDKKYIKSIKAIEDGWKNKIDKRKYPFIYVKNN